MKRFDRRIRLRLQLVRSFRWIALAVALLAAVTIFVALGLMGSDQFYGDLGLAVSLLAVFVAGGALLMDCLDN